MKISIAMTSYNGEKYIREQIDSILNQTYRNFELIICDDCSSDSTWSILKKYSMQDSRIICYRNDVNMGFKRNFEKAMGLCKCQYIALADQDDIWTKEHLEILLTYKSSYSLVCSNAEYLTSDGVKTGSLVKKMNEKEINADRDRQLFILLFNNFVQGCTVLFDKDMLNTTLPIPDEIEFHDYWLGIISILYNGIYYVDKITVLYRRHDDNVTKYNSLGRIKNYKKTTNNRYILSTILWKKFSLSLTPNQKRILRMVHRYIIYSITKKHTLRRIIFFTFNYKKMYLRNSYLFFLPRIILHIFIAPKLSYLNQDDIDERKIQLQSGFI
jgi:glycosyltransferase involved in cell wall biosynthesis